MEKLQKFEIQENDLELVVSKKQLGSLTTNAKKIKEIVEKALPNYNVSNYNESNIGAAKTDKALLNKASKALNSKRIEIEKEFMKPLIEFKDIVGETVKLISECSSKIDTVVKDSEQKEKDNKKVEIQNYFDSKEFDTVSLDKIFDDKWLNKTSKIKEVKSEIDAKIKSIEDDLVTLDALEGDSELLKSIYLENLNINATIQYANKLKENKKKVAPVSSYSSPVLNTASNYVAKEQSEDVQESISQDNTVQSEGASNNEALLTRTFKVTASKDKIIALGNYMNDNGISFEKIEI